MKTVRLLLPLLLFVAGGTLARAQSLDDLAGQMGGTTSSGKAADAGVERQIKSGGFTSYKVDNDGDFKLTVEVPGGRTQLVYVISHTESVGGLTVREVWSPAFKTGGHLSNDDAIRMLKDNNGKKVGAWRLYGEGEKQMAVFAIHLASNASGEALKSAIEFVSKVADLMEKEKTDGKDDF